MAARACNFWILMLAVLFIVLLDSATRGDDYLIAVPQKKQKGHTSIFVESGETGGQVQIQYPRRNWRETRLLLDHGRYIERVDDNMGTTFGIENCSIVVSGSDDNINILVYQANLQANIFSPLPVSTLGSKYIVSSFNPPGHLSVLVLASYGQDADVDIMIKQGNIVYNGRAYTNGDTLSVRLGKHQTFTVTSSTDLTGTVVTSTQKIGLFCGIMTNEELVAYTQLLPVKHYGKEYVVAVDDNSALYQIQIISEDSETQIMFSDGSTVFMDNTQVHRQTLRRNESLYFTSTKPVMTLLYGHGHHSITVIPPVSHYTKQTQFYTYGGERVVKIMADESSDVHSSDADITWQKVGKTKFKIGTSLQKDTILMETNNSFIGTFLVFQRLSIYHTGFRIPVRVMEIAYKGRESYLLAAPVISPGIVSTTGASDGIWLIIYPNTTQSQIRHFKPYTTDLYLTKPAHRVTTGIENKSILVTVIGRDTRAYSSTLLNQNALIPISALGTKYVVSHCHSPGNVISVLVIASHSPNTDVLITFRLDGTVIYNSRTFSNGDIYRVNLYKYQTFTLSSSSSMCGTVVESPQTVAVFSGIQPNPPKSALVSLTYSQLIPVIHYGDEFLVTADDPNVYFEGSTRYYFQILTEKDDTHITFNNGLSVTVGQTRSYRLQLNHNETVYFHTNKPVLCTLCREREDKRTRDKTESCTVVAPTSLYVDKTIITNLNPFVDNLKIQTEHGANVKVMLSTGKSWIRTLPISWESIKDTNYKVGSCRISISIPQDGSTLTVNVESDKRFGLLGFGNLSLFNGGYEIAHNSVKNTTDTDTDTNTGTQTNIGLIVGLTCGILVLLLVVTGILLWRRKSIVECWGKMKPGGKDVVVTRNVAWSDLRKRNGNNKTVVATGIRLNNREGMATSA